MCHIEAVHFIHCRHTNVAFRTCVCTRFDDDGHRQLAANSHSMGRVCPSCLANAVAFILIRTNGYNRKNYEKYVRSKAFELDLAKYESEALRTNPSARAVVASGLRSSHELMINRDIWCPQNSRTISNREPGGINHLDPLLAMQDTFDRAVMCQSGERPDRPVVTYSEAMRWGQRQNAEHWALDNPNLRTFGQSHISEVLVYFSRCRHYNAIFMEVPNSDSPQRSGDTDCGCSGFDLDLPFRRYAESSTDCMFCRRRADHENDPRFRYADRYVRIILDGDGQGQIATWPETARLPR